jgi:hypothetical protein
MRRILAAHVSVQRRFPPLDASGLAGFPAGAAEPADLGDVFVLGAVADVEVAGAPLRAAEDFDVV